MEDILLKLNLIFLYCLKLCIIWMGDVNPNSPELLESLKLPGEGQMALPSNLLRIFQMLKLMPQYIVNFLSWLYNEMSDLIQLDAIKP